jgi:hypothetical protein
VAGQRTARISPPRNLALLGLIAICITACSDEPPRIGRDLPSAFADARPAFDERVKRHFPLGSDETTLITELRAERFKVDTTMAPVSPYGASAEFTAHQLACNKTWAIYWNTSSGKITAIAGDFGASCL